jgi:hypothetical protein
MRVRACCRSVRDARVGEGFANAGFLDCWAGGPASDGLEQAIMYCCARWAQYRAALDISHLTTGAGLSEPPGQRKLLDFSYFGFNPRIISETNGLGHSDRPLIPRGELSGLARRRVWDDEGLKNDALDQNLVTSTAATQQTEPEVVAAISSGRANRQ